MKTRPVYIAGSARTPFVKSMTSYADITTQELMTAFYTDWLKTNDLRGAFRRAQSQLRKKYPQPYYWGAFVLVGN